MGFGPATEPTLKTALCHIRALVGRFDKYRGLRRHSRAFVCGLSSPVLGLHSASGAIPQPYIPFGGGELLPGA